MVFARAADSLKVLYTIYQHERKLPCMRNGPAPGLRKFTTDAITINRSNYSVRSTAGGFKTIHLLSKIVNNTFYDSDYDYGRDYDL